MTINQNKKMLFTIPEENNNILFKIQLFKLHDKKDQLNKIITKYNLNKCDIKYKYDNINTESIYDQSNNIGLFINDIIIAALEMLDFIYNQETIIERKLILDKLLIKKLDSLDNFIEITNLSFEDNQNMINISNKDEFVEKLKNIEDIEKIEILELQMSNKLEFTS